MGANAFHLFVQFQFQRLLRHAQTELGRGRGVSGAQDDVTALDGETQVAVAGRDHGVDVSAHWQSALLQAHEGARLVARWRFFFDGTAVLRFVQAGSAQGVVTQLAAPAGHECAGGAKHVGAQDLLDGCGALDRDAVDPSSDAIEAHAPARARLTPLV